MWRWGEKSSLTICVLLLLLKGSRSLGGHVQRSMSRGKVSRKRDNRNALFRGIGLMAAQNTLYSKISSPEVEEQELGRHALTISGHLPLSVFFFNFRSLIPPRRPPIRLQFPSLVMPFRAASRVSSTRGTLIFRPDWWVTASSH